MMVTRLRLENIRSYRDATIEFPAGTVLFAGDVGSGKSSILHGVEFGLFGLGDLEGTHLLRLGEREGTVELDFTVDGKTYRIVRELKRGKKGVLHGKVWMEVDGRKEEWSVTELRSRVLEILRFNEPPNPRASS